MTVIIFIIVLAVLIFVHELGHFVAAKAFGIRVDAFKIGFGPKLFSWRTKGSDGKPGETEYGLNLIPFGGYVKIFGENPDDENTHGPDSSRSFVHRTRWKQVVVLAAGVLFNFLFAWLLYIVVFSNGVATTPDSFPQYTQYENNPRIMVTDVQTDSPADKAGLQIGDVVTAVGGVQYDEGNQKVNTDDEITAIKNAINASAGKNLSVSYLRGNQSKTISIAAATGIVPDKYAIGIAMDSVVDIRLPVFSAISQGLEYTGVMMWQTASGLGDFVGNIFAGAADFSQISGPVGIAGIVGSAAQLGFIYLLMITALISINLGIVNLIPFPALDGGRILFVAIEGIIRRRISPRFTNTVNAVGFVLLMVLMVAVTYKDILKLVK